MIKELGKQKQKEREKTMENKVSNTIYGNAVAYDSAKCFAGNNVEVIAADKVTYTTKGITLKESDSGKTIIVAYDK